MPADSSSDANCRNAGSASGSLVSDDETKRISSSAPTRLEEFRAYFRVFGSVCPSRTASRTLRPPRRKARAASASPSSAKVVAVMASSIFFIILFSLSASINTPLRAKLLPCRGPLVLRRPFGLPRPLFFLHDLPRGLEFAFLGERRGRHHGLHFLKQAFHGMFLLSGKIDLFV